MAKAVDFAEVAILHKREGSFLSGVVLKPQVLKRDVLQGGPIVALQSSSVQEGFKTNRFTSHAKPAETKLYQTYFKCLGKTPLKERLNASLRKNLPEEDGLVSSVIETTTFGSSDFRDLVTKQILKDLGNLKPYGGIE